MAYREFYQPQEFSVADSDYISQGVTGLFNALAQRQKAQQEEAKDFNYELKGKSESDQKLLSEYAKSVFNKGLNEIRSGRGTSADTKRKMAEGKHFAELSEIQFKEADALQKEILAKETKDPYYNSAPALRGLKLAYDGEGGEKNLFNRDLKSFAKTIDRVSVNPEESTFKQFQYRQDYIKKFKDRLVETSSKNPNVARSKYNQAVFWDDEKSTPGVTDQHAIDYLKSDARMDDYFTEAVNDKLLKEIKSMKASGDPRVAWMKGGNAANLTGKGKGLSDEQILQELIADPTKNIIDSTPFGKRKRELAKDDLRRADQVNSKVSVEYMEPKEARNADGTLDTVSHGSTYVADTFAQLAAPPTYAQQSGNALGFKPTVGGPGGNLMTKKGVNPGKPLVTDLSSGKAFNFGEGRMISRPNGKFNITGYQLNANDLDGNIKPLGGNTTQELISSINAMSPSDFKRMAPEMKISIKGYALDDTKMLGDISKETEKLNTEIAKAEDDGDDDKVERLNYRLNKLEQLRTMYNQPNMLDEDVMNSALSAGIKQIRVDQLIPANSADIDRLSSLTGLNLKDQQKWSDDMKAVQQAYRNKWNEARAANFGEAKQEEMKKEAPKQEAPQIKEITSWEEHKALPIGAEYTFGGKTYKKK